MYYLTSGNTSCVRGSWIEKKKKTPLHLTASRYVLMVLNHEMAVEGKTKDSMEATIHSNPRVQIKKKQQQKKRGLALQSH